MTFVRSSFVVDHELAYHGKASNVQLMKVPEQSILIKGHFPSDPILPGVYLIDTAAGLVQKSGSVILSIERARFMAPCIPPEEILAEISATHENRSTVTLWSGDKTKKFAVVRFGVEAKNEL